MKRLLSLLLALTTITATQAQEDEVQSTSSRKKFVNMNFSGLMGNALLKHTVSENGYKFGDIPLMGGAVELEWALKGIRYQIEFNYQQADMTDCTRNTVGKPTFEYDKKFAENLKIMSGLFYFGTTINPCKRFQIPIYGGFGGEYIQGYPAENFSFCFCFKGRAVLYLTKNVGLFAGYRYKMSALEKKNNDLEGLGENDKMEYVNQYHMGEVGLTVMLGRMGGNKQ